MVQGLGHPFQTVSTVLHKPHPVPQRKSQAISGITSELKGNQRVKSQWQHCQSTSLLPQGKSQIQHMVANMCWAANDFITMEATNSIISLVALSTASTNYWWSRVPDSLMDDHSHHSVLDSWAQLGLSKTCQADALNLDKITEEGSLVTFNTHSKSPGPLRNWSPDTKRWMSRAKQWNHFQIIAPVSLNVAYTQPPAILPSAHHYDNGISYPGPLPPYAKGYINNLPSHKLNPMPWH